MNRRRREKCAAIVLAGVGLASIALGEDGRKDAGAPVLERARKGEVVPPALEDVEQMCALLTSCDALPIPPSMLPSDFAACVKTMSENLTRGGALSFSLTVRECGLGANSCTQLRACALRGAKPDACVGRGRAAPAGYCDSAGRALTCVRGRVAAVRDCPRGGEQCAVRDGQAVCALGACGAGADAGGPSCSASGTRILQCEKGTLVSVDCSAFGLSCASQADGAACAPATSACTGDTKRCEGNIAVECLHGHEVRVDCAASGLACGGPGTAVGACVAPVSASGACDTASPARCEGASIKYCASGRPRSYPCKSLAFSRCAADGTSARCAN